MLDRNILNLPGARRMFVLLLMCAGADALLIVAQALCLAGALSWMWNCTVAQAFVSLVPGALPGAFGFAAAFIARNALDAVRSRMADAFSRKRATELQDRLVEATYEQGVTGVQRRGSGSAVQELIDGVANVRNYIAIILPKVADLIAIPVILAVALFASDWISGIIALIILPCIIGYMQLLGAHAKAQASAQHQEYDRLANHFMDTLRGLATLKAFGRSKPYANQVFAVSEAFRDATVKTLRTATLSSLGLDLFRTFALAAVAIMLGFRLLNGSVGLEPALAVLIMVPEYFAAVRRYSTDFHASLDGRNSLTSILNVIGGEGEQTPSASVAVRGACTGAESGTSPALSVAQTADAAGVPCEAGEGRALATAATAGAAGDEGEPCEAGEGSALPVEGTADDAAEKPCETDALNWDNISTLEFRDVSFRHSSNDPFALNQVNFRVEGSCKVGIVGMSGSGKTTLARLLAGFSNPTAGEILVNGASIPTLNNPWWLKLVTFIPQNPHIFNASLRDNVAFYVPGASEHDVDQAIKLAGLEDTVAQLPQGVNTLLGQQGRQLSGGQAQRVTLARAFLDSQRRVLIFDEPTAHLDIQTELALKERMLPLMEGRLVFFATHRLHWLENMDYVLVVEDGRVVESGRPCELLAANGALSSLVKQMRGGDFL